MCFSSSYLEKQGYIFFIYQGTQERISQIELKV